MSSMEPDDIENKFPYSGIPTFYKFPYSKDLNNVDIAIIGVPFDHGTTNRPGTRFGPRSIRIASQNYGIYIHPSYGAYDLELQKNILSGIKAIDYGDVPILPTHTKTNMHMIHDTFKEIVESNVFPVTFGGDHTITFPLIDAFDVPLDIIHFDTHLDFIDNVGGVKFSHSNPIKRASELENVNSITQIGIRGFTDRKTNYEEAQKYGAKIVTAKEVFEKGIYYALQTIPDAENIYVTFDIDALDPSIAPGTGTPEFGGFSYLQMKEMLTELPKIGNIIGFDIVEVNPLFDVADMTSQVAARLALDFLAAIFS
ncbi:agmatinase [Methanobacterium oryzae]|uniref:agmatinase n=1 Tax=Methanobacterium oryzae TaxID=69540 RepID=UPI003D202F27